MLAPPCHWPASPTGAETLSVSSKLRLQHLAHCPAETVHGHRRNYISLKGSGTLAWAAAMSLKTSEGLGWRLRTCISIKLPGAAGASGSPSVL